MIAILHVFQVAPGKCYEYNEANKLKKVKQCSNNQTIAEYIYDYAGIRLIKKNYINGTLANTVTSWTKSFETKAIEGGSTETTNYYFANGELVAKKNPDGSKVYFHNDHLGSATILTNQAGSLIEETKYDPWGKVLSGGSQSKYQYTGQEKDAETGLNYMNARYYGSDLHHFTQPDPLVQNIYDPQMLNRYAYARNNPLKYTDPSGNVVSCSAKGCSSSISVLNRPQQTQPRQQTASIALNLPYIAAAYSKISTPPSPQPQSRASNNQNNNSSNNSSSNGSGNSGSNRSAGQSNNPGNTNQGGGSVQGAQSSPERITVGEALIQGIQASKANQVNSVGFCLQGSGALGAGAGGGFTASGCVHFTKRNGIVLTGGGGIHYVPAGAALGIGPAVTVSNAESTAELGGVDLTVGGSAKAFGGAQIDHSRSIDPGNIGIWSTTVNPQLGAGGDLHAGMTTTGAIDIPWW